MEQCQKASHSEIKPSLSTSGNDHTESFADVFPSGVLPRPLRGVIPPIVTPLLDHDSLDIDGLERLVGHILVGDPSGLFILGTTGEGPSLSYRLRREMIKHTCHIVAGRVPALVGITDTSLVESLGLAQYAADSGADAVVLAPPYYYCFTEQDELAEYVEKIVANLPLPLFLYNMPAMTKLVYETATVRRLMECPDIIGIKDSSGDLDYFNRLLGIAEQRSDWSVLAGHDLLMAETVLRGGHGGVTGGANLVPDLFVKIYKAAVRGDTACIAQMQQQLLQLWKLYEIGGRASASIVGLKCALSLIGICSDCVAYLLRRLEESDCNKIRLLLEKIDLTARKE